MRHFLRIFIGFSVILLALSVTAGSCNKSATPKSTINSTNTNTNDGVGSGSGGSGSGGSGSGGSGSGGSGSGGSGSGGSGSGGDNAPASYSICEDKGGDFCLELKVTRAAEMINFAKLEGKDTIVMNADSIAKSFLIPQSASDAERSFIDLVRLRRIFGVFDVNYPGRKKKSLLFVNRNHVNTNTIALDAVTTIWPRGESGDNALANQAGGSALRIYNTEGHIPKGRILYNNNFLGTVFDNTNTNTHARGLMMCQAHLDDWDTTNAEYRIITDAVNVGRAFSTCFFGMVNSRKDVLTAEIDDDWVDTGKTEVELYAIGIDVDGKPISEIAKDLGFTFTAGNGLAEFNKAWDNDAMKRLLSKYPWADLKFKVKIVKSAEYATL